jgi:hypothetical protein
MGNELSKLTQVIHKAMWITCLSLGIFSLKIQFNIKKQEKIVPIALRAIVDNLFLFQYGKYFIQFQ